MILQLDSTKTSDNKSNLAHFLVKTVQTKYPEVLTVSDELKHMAAAAKGQLVSCILIKD